MLAAMNLADVARRARVSTATVSRVLNGGDRVRPATRDRVNRAIEELGYTPNLIARSLAGGKTRSIGMIVSNLENPFFLDIFRGVELHARKHGYEILVANTDYSPERLASSITMMHGRRVAGLALVVSEPVPANIAALAGRDTPIVLYDGNGNRFKQAMNIRANYRAGMRQIVEFLRSAIGAWRSSDTTSPWPARRARQAFSL